MEISDNEILFSLKLREEELIKKINYYERKRNGTSNFDKEIIFGCKRDDFQLELNDIREKIKELESK